MPVPEAVPATFKRSQPQPNPKSKPSLRPAPGPGYRHLRYTLRFATEPVPFAFDAGATKCQEGREHRTPRNVGRGHGLLHGFHPRLHGYWSVAFAWLGREQIPVHLLGTITAMGVIVLYFVRSVTVLVLYGSHLEPEDA